VPNKTKVGKITSAQIAELAEKKIKDMNAHTPEAAAKIIAGQARSMGIEVTD
jgi:large subunit ribosomal protein L11